MVTKPLPTMDELEQQHAAAQEHLRQVRARVASGDADARELDEAASAARYAATRIEAIHEARQARQRQADEQRATEIAGELDALDALIAKQDEREQQLRAIAAEYVAAEREIRAEIAGAYGELLGIADRCRRVGPRTMLRDMGIRVMQASTSIRVQGKRYESRGLAAVLGEIEYESRTRAGIASGEKAA